MRARNTVMGPSRMRDCIPQCTDGWRMVDDLGARAVKDGHLLQRAVLDHGVKPLADGGAEFVAWRVEADHAEPPIGGGVSGGLP